MHFWDTQISEPSVMVYYELEDEDSWLEIKEVD